MADLVAHIDFESCSALDLTEVGTHNYVRHPTTDVWCMGWAIGDDEPELWLPGNPFPDNLAAALDAGYTFMAHNAPFELAVWNEIMVKRYGWPELRPEQVQCTMAMAYTQGFPGKLADAAPAVGIDTRKDEAGHRLMLKMCRPRKINADGSIVWWDEPENIARLGEYCKHDVIVERELAKRLRPLTEYERRVWLLDYKINQRGIRVDVPAIKAAIATVESEQDRLSERLRKVTNHYVSFATEVARLTSWVRTRGVMIDSLAKADVLDALADETIPDDVREALLIRKEAGRSSTAKLNKMLLAADEDGRVRGTHQYHGAGTGRWAGRLIQPHNFMRPTMPQEVIEEAVNHLGNPDLLDMCFGAPMDVIANCMRAMIIPADGNKLLVGDFANIEGRVLAWEAGEEWKLEAFRKQDAKTGPEIYILAAAKIYGADPSAFNKQSPERQIGKVSELALGYQGGVGAFQQMAKGYNVKIGDDLADEVKVKWRDAHPKIVKYWYAVEDAALSAMFKPGTVFTAGPAARQVKFVKAGSFLVCRLPSGRNLYYPHSKVMEIDTPWGDRKDAVTYMTVVDQSKRGTEKIIPDPYANGRWQRVATYGGKLTENITQALARDLLADALLRLDDCGLEISMHVHDEVVCDVSAGLWYVQGYEKEMAKLPAWAEGLPVAVEAWIGSRYRK